MTAYFTDSLSSEFRRAIERAISEIEEEQNPNAKQKKKKIGLDSKTNPAGNDAVRPKQISRKQSHQQATSVIQINRRKSASRAKKRKKKEIRSQQNF